MNGQRKRQRPEEREPCRSQRPLLHRLVDGELEPEQRVAVRRHLGRCAGCRSYVHKIRVQEETLRRATMPTRSELACLWSEDLQRRLRDEAVRELGIALFAWVAARQRLRRVVFPVLVREGARPGRGGARTAQPGAAECHAAVRACARRVERWCAAAGRPGISLPLTSERAALDAFAVLAKGPHLRAPLRWCRVLLALESHTPGRARYLLRLCADTPVALHKALESWVRGTPVPLPVP